MQQGCDMDQRLYGVTQKKRNPILIILNTRVPFFLGHPVYYIEIISIIPWPYCLQVCL